MWRWLTGGGLLVVVTGLLPAGDAADVLTRVAPVLLFLAAITVVAELADAAGVFGVAADSAARLARGSVVGLFFLIAALASATTVLLLAADRLDALGVSFTRLMAAPALAVLAVSLVVVWARYRQQLGGRYTVADTFPVQDRVLFFVAAATCVSIGALVAVGGDVTIIASTGAVVLVQAFVVRRRDQLHTELVPWRLVVSTAGLFLLVQAALELGADGVLRDAAGTGDGTLDLLRLAATAAGASNLVNNLPAYLALEPDAQLSATRLAALLIGTNAGPLILPWGSLATLLWLDRCRARDVRIPLRHIMLLVLVSVPLLLAAGVFALTLS